MRVGTDKGLPAILAGQCTPPGRQSVGTAQGAQVPDQPPDIHKGQAQHLHIHHRLYKAMPYQSIPQIMHVSEIMHVSKGIDMIPGDPRLAQGIRPQTDEHQRATRTQYPGNLTQHFVDITPG